jgi:TonB-linked SusC/RagA family outer membrane protein
MLRRIVRNGSKLFAGALLVMAIPAGLQAQNGQVSGTITDRESGGPLSTVQIFVQGTSLGTLSTATGTFSIGNVPPGTYTVIAQRIGYSEARQTGVSVTPGSTTSLSLTMSPAVLALQGVVATGLVDPVEGVRSPITVAAVTKEMMPVTVAGNAVQNLQGRVSGVRINRASGQPGSEVSMILRTPTSVTGSGAPMIVVDGVILSGTNTIDIEAMDIESMEVIKGAAAASLYGSRAASGVISIKTARGRGLELGQTRFTARSELGITQALKHDYVATHHRFLMDPTNSFYVDATGKQVGRNQRVAPAPTQAFMDKPYPGPIYNNVDAVAQPGGFRSNSFGVSGNTEYTNFALTLNSYKEEGALANNDGYYRNSIRTNLDHRYGESLTLGVSLYHARDGRDNISGTNPFDEALSAPIDVDFSVKGPDGQYLQQPDPTIVQQNPLWTQATRDNNQKSTRTLFGANLAWTPLSFMTASGALGYDRSDGRTRVYVPKGTPANVGTDGELDGELSFTNSLSDTWNLEGQVSFKHDIGAMNLRTTFRGLMEESASQSGTRSGTNFILYGVPQLSNIATANQRATSTEQEVWAEGYLWDTALDYDGKYVFTVLGRRDGSSLFGPDNRWHDYYRIAGAWRLGQESWFNIPGVSEFKLSYARGTAGGRPGFAAQYETWTLSSGIPTKGNLGNRFLAPEHTTENEISLNMILFDRVGVVLTHARQKTTDQLVQAPLPIITGFSTQWINAGTVEGYTTELEVEGQLVRKQNFGWTTMLVADKSYSEITEWPIPCDATNAWRLYCAGEPVYGLFALHLVNANKTGSLEAALEKHRAFDTKEFLDQFQVNDEGYVVWVGKGNNYTDGISKKLWGTTSAPIGNCSSPAGCRTYEWGQPFHEQNELGQNQRQLLGKSNPYNFGFINNLRLGGFNFHAQFQAAIGGDANNRATHTLINGYNSRQMDQFGKEEGLKKPVAYYLTAIQGNTDYVVEDATYLKLRTLSANYALNRARIESLGLARTGIQNLTVGLIVRNVAQWTGYDGFDPESALNLNNRSNADGGGYPPTRNLTAEIGITF